MIFIENVFDVAPEVRDAVVALTRRTTDASRREHGCVLYRFTNDCELPTRFVLTEIWEDETALTSHFAGEAFRRFWAELPARGGGPVSNRALQGPLTDYVTPDPGIDFAALHE